MWMWCVYAMCMCRLRACAYVNACVTEIKVMLL